MEKNSGEKRERKVNKLRGWKRFNESFVLISKTRSERTASHLSLSLSSRGRQEKRKREKDGKYRVRQWDMFTLWEKFQHHNDDDDERRKKKKWWRLLLLMEMMWVVNLHLSLPLSLYFSLYRERKKEIERGERRNVWIEENEERRKKYKQRSRKGKRNLSNGDDPHYKYFLSSSHGMECDWKVWKTQLWNQVRGKEVSQVKKSKVYQKSIKSRGKNISRVIFIFWLITHQQVSIFENLSNPTRFERKNPDKIWNLSSI